MVPVDARRARGLAPSRRHLQLRETQHPFSALAMHVDARSRLTAALADRYLLGDEIGVGATARVYRAVDLRHDRTVALKVLKPELAAALGSDRFIREITLMAGLDHPHILPVLDSGDSDGFLYYAMPYVEGESLRDCLDREHQLAVDEAVRITLDVADALSYAHGRGIVHRDIKPENILLAAGHARVVDFGYGRAIEAAGGSSLTASGLAMGTPAYMSPEQATDCRVADGRSDVYSLGCVLFELLAGEPPFTGSNLRTILARHMTQPAPTLRSIRPEVPRAIDLVVQRALAKSPTDRFATADNFARALKQGVTPRLRHQRLIQGTLIGVIGLSVAVAVVLQSRSPGTGDPSVGADLNRVAVLYFDDSSPDGSLGWLARSLTEDLIDALSESRDLTVTSRNGVRPYIGTSVSADSIGRALDVGLLVDGSLAPADSTGRSVRVLLRLVDAATGVQLERLTAIRDRDEPLALRADLTGDLELLLRERIGAHVRLRQDRDAAGNDVAWENVRRARQLQEDAVRLMNARDHSGAALRLRRADELLGRAESAARSWRRPTIERAELSLTRALAAQGTADTITYDGSLATHLGNGLDHVDRVLSRDPDEAHALTLRGEILIHLATFGGSERGDTLLETAHADLSRAISLNPATARALYALSSALNMMGRLQEARVVGNMAR